jgi:hypothetical protein
MMKCTGMEFSDWLMEECVKGSGNRIIKMAKDIRDGQMEMNIGESSRKASHREKESNNGTEYYTMSNTKKVNSSPIVKYREILQAMST